MTGHPVPARTIRAAVEERRIVSAYARRARHERDYSWFRPGHVFQVQDQERQTLRALARAGLDSVADRDILDLGCGSGAWLQRLVRWGATPARLTGVDLRRSVLMTARRRCPASVHLRQASATRLPFPDDAFDLVLQATVFSSVLDADVRRVMAAEMVRVVRPTGVVLWYDLRIGNPRNPDVGGLSRRAVRRLFPGCQLALTSVSLAPPLVRALAGRSWIVTSLLAQIPFLRTHLLGVIAKGTR